MTLKTLVVSLILSLTVPLAATLWRGGDREARAAVQTPAEGQIVTVDGQRIHALIKGQGPTLVLLHGASGSLRDWTFGLMDRLAQDYRVVALDRPGLGHSAAGQDNSLDAQARTLRKALVELGIVQPFVLVGQSFGGSVALAWALQEPPAALVLISAPSLPWEGGLDPWYRVNETALARALLVPLAAAWVPEAYVRKSMAAVFAPDSMPAGYDDHLGVLQSLRPRQLDQNLQQVNALLAQVTAMAPQYPALSLPVELVHGTEDTIVPLAIHSALLVEVIPDAALTVVPGAGHMPHHSHPEVVLAAIARALSRSGLR
jgi:pimeloyl-ACP methyl ester carboxylesterase